MDNHKGPLVSGFVYRGLLKGIVVTTVIITVLLFVLIPKSNILVANAKKSWAAGNASRIAMGYAAYTLATKAAISTPQQNQTGTRFTGTAHDINDVAFILAQKAGLNDAKVWFISSDDALAGAEIPRLVISGNIQAATVVTKDFANLTKSWTFVIGLPLEAPTSTTPLLWTYGLQHNGKWSEASPWDGRGGHIAFLDGHVEWFDQLSTAPKERGLTVYPTNRNPGTMTADWGQAIPSSGKLWAQVKNLDGRGK